LWGSFKGLIEEQYLLTRKCNISISDSNSMADFERQIFVSLAIKEIEEEKKAMSKAGKT